MGREETCKLRGGKTNVKFSMFLPQVDERGRVNESGERLDGRHLSLTRQAEAMVQETSPRPGVGLCCHRRCSRRASPGGTGDKSTLHNPATSGAQHVIIGRRAGGLNLGLSDLCRGGWLLNTEIGQFLTNSG